MSLYDTNPYYNPQNLGLKIVDEAELSSGSYEFDMVVLWKSEDGMWFIGSDSGCSCPSPFEWVCDVDEDLTVIESFAHLGAYLYDFVHNHWRYDDPELEKGAPMWVHEMMTKAAKAGL